MYWIEEFEKSLDDLKNRKHDMEPRLYEVMLDSMESQLDVLYTELDTYGDD
jgi:hypothetical protein